MGCAISTTPKSPENTITTMGNNQIGTGGLRKKTSTNGEKTNGTSPTDPPMPNSAPPQPPSQQQQQQQQPSTSITPPPPTTTTTSEKKGSMTEKGKLDKDKKNATEHKSKHLSVGPANPKLEALQSEKQVQKQIDAIARDAPRKTLVGKGELESTTVEGSKFKVIYAYTSQTGYYPENLHKANQDTLEVKAPFPPAPGTNAPPMHFFAVYDGHGTHGDACSQFARDHVPVNLANSEAFKRGDYEKAFHDAYVQTNSDMHLQERYGKFSDMLSGTTAIAGLLVGRSLYVANVGDSRAIMGVRDESGKLRAEALSIDQTPFREDERNRVKKAGARVLTMDQIEGYRDINDQNFGNEDEDDGDPPRLWSPDGAFPGTAFTRSIGDLVAERIGVFAEPEMLRKDLAQDDEFLLIASDGVFEFLSSQSVADIVGYYDDPVEACRAVVAESYRLWLQYEVRTDDISVILVRFKDLQPAPRGPARLERTRSNIKDTIKAGEVRPVRRNLSRVKMGAVGQMHIDAAEFEGYVLPVYPKSKEETARIKAAVRANFLFRHLNEEQLDKAVSAMETITVKSKDVIIKQFDEGDKFYIADFGEYDVEVAVPKTRPNPNDPDTPLPIEGEFEPPRRVFTYDSKHGNNPCFGELALMYSKPRAATVLARTDGRLWALERRAFRSILMKTPAKRLIQLLRKVEVLKPLSRVDLQRMADLMTEEKFKDGSYIVKQGETGDAFYIITEGRAVVTKTEVGADKPNKVMELTEYMYFGERSLLHDAPRAANVIAVGGVKVLSIHRRDFEMVLGHIEDRIDADRDLREKKSRRQLLTEDTAVIDERNAFAKDVKDVEDLNGGVWASATPFAIGAASIRITQHDGSYMLLKTISKRTITQRKEVALLMNDLRIMRDLVAKSVYVPTLIGTMSSPNVLHCVLSNAIIADFSRFLGKPLPRDHIQYATFCVSSGLEFLQSLLVLYRGLVPEAIGLDRKGVLQLIDFRFSKILLETDRTFTICGTPEYMSPEQVAGIGHGWEADWWSVGVFAYECLIGSTPWGGEGKNEISIYSAISAFNGNLTFPPGSDELAVSFIRAILQPEVDSRFGTATEVLNHPFLKKIDVSVKERSPFEAQAKELFSACIAGARIEGLNSDLDPMANPATVLDQSVFAGW